MSHLSIQPPLTCLPSPTAPAPVPAPVPGPGHFSLCHWPNALLKPRWAEVLASDSCLRSGGGLALTSAPHPQRPMLGPDSTCCTRWCFPRCLQLLGQQGISREHILRACWRPYCYSVTFMGSELVQNSCTRPNGLQTKSEALSHR